MPVLKERTDPQSSQIVKVKVKGHGKAPPTPTNQTTEPLPPVNGILILNDDCLLQIMSFVDVHDLLELHSVHQRFQWLFRIAVKKAGPNGIIISESLLKRYPLATSKELYEFIGEFTWKLAIRVRGEKDFLAFLKCFPKTTDLEISQTDLKKVSAIDQIPLLTHLHLNTKDIPPYYARKLFRHLNKTLTYLSYSLNYTTDLLPLHNLTRIRIPIEGMGRGLDRLLAVNPQLNHVEMYLHDNSFIMAGDWSFAFNAPSLTELVLEGLGRTCLDMRAVRRVNNIHLLDISIERKDPVCSCHKNLLENAGIQLKKVILRNPLNDENPLEFLTLIRKLKRLEVLHVDFRFIDPVENIVGHMRPFLKLKSLKLWIDSPDVTLQIIMMLEKLTEMDNRLVVDNAEFEEALSDYLRNDGRTLMYNKSKEIGLALWS